MAVVVFGGDGGGAVNHHGAEQAEAQRYPKQPTIAFCASRHWFTSFPRLLGLKPNAPCDWPTRERVA